MHYQRLWKRGTTDPRAKRAPRRCLVDGCDGDPDRPGTALGYCSKHYNRFKATGDPLLTKRALWPTVCVVTGCERPVSGLGLCAMHYQRLRTTGRLDRRSAEERFWSFVGEADENGCRMWRGGRDKDGYGDFFDRGKIKAHRFAHVLAHGPIPPGRLVLHSCDNPSCVEVAHLRVGTSSDNKQDELKRQRNNPPRGTRNPRAVLDDDKVRAMRALHAQGYGARRQSRMWGLNEGTIASVINGSNWRHVV